MQAKWTPADGADGLRLLDSLLTFGAEGKQTSIKITGIEEGESKFVLQRANLASTGQRYTATDLVSSYRITCLISRPNGSKTAVVVVAAELLNVFYAGIQSPLLTSLSEAEQQMVRFVCEVAKARLKGAPDPSTSTIQTHNTVLASFGISTDTPDDDDEFPVISLEDV